VAQIFAKNGFTTVFALKGGWKAWEKAGYPTEKK
jgi:rhodanese-related sulfurtransferase